MRVPAHMQDTAKTLALRSWVEAKDFPIDDYCEAIDEAHGLVSRFSKDGDDDGIDNEKLVLVLALLLDQEGALLTYALAEEAEIEDPDHWSKICQAAGWVILQRYKLLRKRGEWPRG